MARITKHYCAICKKRLSPMTGKLVGKTARVRLCDDCYTEAKKLHFVKYRFTRQIFGKNWQRSKAAQEFYCYEWESGRGGKPRKAV